MRLICYPTCADPPRIVPAPVERHWMERTPQDYAYRCLPLNIANAHGWFILNTVPFVAEWDGWFGAEALVVRPTGAGGPLLPSSHFGSGVLTFPVGMLFRTEPGYDLMVCGPANQPKDAIQPLSGIVETDWAPFTFTMNWMFTRAQTPVTFAAGEPFCMIFPVKRGLLETVDPEIRSLDTDEEARRAFAAWAESRSEFNRELRVPGSSAQAQKWQKDYFRGSTRFGNPPPDHRTKLKVKEFRRSE